MFKKNNDSQSNEEIEDGTSQVGNTKMVVRQKQMKVNVAMLKEVKHR